MFRSTISTRLVVNRILVLSAAILLAEQAAPAAGPARTISVTGQFTSGGNVTATCSLASTGQISGTGTLYGMSTSNGSSYPFSINKISTSTAAGKITLTGNFAPSIGGWPVTLTASVPSGALSFTYVVNGRSYTSAGRGTVNIY